VNICKINRQLLLAIAAVACLSTTTSATIISYGTLNGADVMYINIEEDTRDEPNALFGPPTVAGNFLDFDPLSFATSSSSSTGTNNSNILDGQLNFTVMSNDSLFDITNVVISESGDFTTIGLGAAQATATVAAPVLYTVTHVGGNPLGTPVAGSGNVVFTPNGGTYGIADGPTGFWDGTLDVDIRAALDAAGVGGPATKIEFVLDNTLTTSAIDGGSAFIAKKDFNVDVVGEVVPEPSSLSLLGLGFLMFLGRVRRK